MDYRGIRYRIRARIERGQWFVVIRETGVCRRPRPLHRLSLLTPPILFGLACHRWRFRIFDLHPMGRPAPVID
jgi:hypothetical protein